MKNYLDLNDKIKEGLPYFNSLNAVSIYRNNPFLYDIPFRSYSHSILSSPGLLELNESLEFHKRVRNEVNPLLYNYKVNLYSNVESKQEKLEFEMNQFNNELNPIKTKIIELENKIKQIENNMLENRKSDLEIINEVKNSTSSLILKNNNELKEEINSKYNESNSIIEKKEQENKEYFNKKENEINEYFEKKKLQNKEYIEKIEQQCKEYIDKNNDNLLNNINAFDKKLLELEKLKLIENNIKGINNGIDKMEKNFELFLQNMDDLENNFNNNFLSKIEFFNYYNKHNNLLSQFQNDYLDFKNSNNLLKPINNTFQNNYKVKNNSYELSNKINFLEEMIEEHQKLIISYNERFKLHDKELKNIKNIIKNN